MPGRTRPGGRPRRPAATGSRASGGRRRTAAGGSGRAGRRTPRRIRRGRARRAARRSAAAAGGLRVEAGSGRSVRAALTLPLAYGSSIGRRLRHTLTPMLAASRADVKGWIVISFTFVPEDLPVRPGLAIPLSELELRTSRSSGPGGQHANVTASRVEAVFDVDGSEALDEAQKQLLRERLGDRATAVAQEHRGQARNRQLALERLREKLAAGLVVPKRRRPTKPGKAAKEKRLDTKRRRSARKSTRRRPSIED